VDIEKKEVLKFYAHFKLDTGGELNWIN